MNMLYKYIFAPLALQEYAEAIKWYEARSEKAAEQFIADAEGRIELICADPYRYRQTHKLFREISLNKFPYYVVYYIDETNKVVILFSLYHHKRNPKKKYKR